MKKQIIKIKLYRLGTVGFLLFCAAVYFGCSIQFSLLSVRQMTVLTVIFLLGMRSVWVPFSFAAIRAKEYPDTDALFFFDGIKRYLYALTADLLANIARITATILGFPAGVCVYFARLSLGEGSGVTALILLLCGAVLIICAALGSIAVWHSIKKATARSVKRIR